jgi:hypothetical protein
MIGRDLVFGGAMAMEGVDRDEDVLRPLRRLSLGKPARSLGSE